MANNKQKELNKIIENCISCCITKEGTNQVVKEKVLGKARSINIVMTRCACVNQLGQKDIINQMQQGFSYTNTGLERGFSNVGNLI